MENNEQSSQQLKTAIQYITIGFLFHILILNIMWIPEIEGFISVLYFFIGLRMMKNLNRYLRYAYYLSLYFLGAYLFITIIMIQTPFKIPETYFVFSAILKAIQITIIFMGLKKYSPSLHLSIPLISYYIFCLSGFVLAGEDVNFFIVAIVLVLIYFIYRSFKVCWIDAEKNQICIIEPSYKISTGIVIIGYCVSLFVIGYIVIWVWPLLSYHYQDFYQPSYLHLDILDTTNQIEGWDDATIYKMNAYQNLYVFHKEEKLDREYAMIDSQIYCNYSFSHDDSQIRGIDFSNGKQSYCTDDKTDEHFSSIDSLFDINRRYYRTFLNPFDQTMDITLEIIAPASTINSEDDEEQRIIVSGEIKYYEYGDTYFGDMHVQKIQNFDASSYKGKWIFNNEYE